jgi:Fur family ferric uptake transcriptional regulator/Fur family peroxide stress response transcriptional regulator
MDHPSAREICQRVKARRPGIGSATVYRTLNLFVAHGRIVELKSGDVARYDANTTPHGHVRCTGCNAIADVDLPLPISTTWRAARDSGFDVNGYELQFLGRCAACQGH